MFKNNLSVLKKSETAPAAVDLQPLPKGFLSGLEGLAGFEDGKCICSVMITGVSRVSMNNAPAEPHNDTRHLVQTEALTQG